MPSSHPCVQGRQKERERKAHRQPKDALETPPLFLPFSLSLFLSPQWILSEERKKVKLALFIFSHRESISSLHGTASMLRYSIFFRKRGKKATTSFPTLPWGGEWKFLTFLFPFFPFALSLSCFPGCHFQGVVSQKSLVDTRKRKSPFFAGRRKKERKWKEGGGGEWSGGEGRER